MMIYSVEQDPCVGRPVHVHHWEWLQRLQMIDIKIIHMMIYSCRTGSLCRETSPCLSSGMAAATPDDRHKLAGR